MAPSQPKWPSSTTTSTSKPTMLPRSSLDEPSLLAELEFNPTLIWRKTRSLLNPLQGTPGFATRVCSRPLTENAFGVQEHPALIAYPCFLMMIPVIVKKLYMDFANAVAING
ncbi:hypothetical protein Dimus_034745 [Dionaea muscipula]